MSEGLAQPEGNFSISAMSWWPEAFDSSQEDFRALLDRRVPQIAMLFVDHSPFPGIGIGPPNIQEKWSDSQVPVRFGSEVSIPLLLVDVLHAFREAGKNDTADWYEQYFLPHEIGQNGVDISLINYAINTGVLYFPKHGACELR